MPEESENGTPGPEEVGEPKEPLIDQVARNEEPLVRIFNAVADRIQGELAENRRYRRALAVSQSRTAFWIVMAVLAGILVAIGSTAFLVFRGFLSGETYVFLLGTLLGSLITFLAERVVPLLYLPIEEEVE